MKVKILSDITMNLFVQELLAIDGYLVIDTEYFDNLVAGIQSQKREEIDKYHFVFIHFDCFFHKRDGLYLNELFSSINNSLLGSKPIVILSNAITESFP